MKETRRKEKPSPFRIVGREKEGLSSEARSAVRPLHVSRCRKGAGAAAFGGDGEAVIADDLHHPPAFHGLELMLAPLAVHKDDTHDQLRECRKRQATPSFFCRLVDDVVYWNVTFASGFAYLNAACAISAASWKPERMSFSLPG